MAINPLPEPLLVASEADLADLVRRLEQRSFFTFDTEFVRTDTFFANVGLLQVSDGQYCWLIDPLATLDLQPLVTLLEDPSITKVIHSCSEDLEVLRHSLNCQPQSVFDTQIAAAFTGFGFSRGYGRLIEEVLSISLDKHETRSDWLQRPLTPSQQRYAAEDVYYLAYLYQHLDQQLRATQRSAWMDEEMTRVIDNNQPVSGKDYYLKVKGAWKLNQLSLAILQLLCEWRETEARQCNRPRRRVVDDKVLFEIAFHQTDEVAKLASETSMSPGGIRKYGQTVITLVEKAKGAEVLPPLLPKPIPREMSGRLKQLKQYALQQAEALNLPVEILAKKADMEAAVRYANQQSSFPERLATGWRYDIIGKSILEMLETGAA